jgi:hypothetical protein
MRKITAILLWIFCGSLGISEIKPIAVWRFEKGINEINNGGKGQLFGEASIKNGSLILNGKGSYFMSEPLKTPLKAKSLFVSCRLGRLDQQQVQLASISGLKGIPNDSIAYNWLDRNRWGPASEEGYRSSKINGEPEEKDKSANIQIISTYDESGKIQFYRNGKLYGNSFTPDSPTQDYLDGKYVLILGAQINSRDGLPFQFYEGEIDEVRIYDKALSLSEIINLAK